MKLRCPWLWFVLLPGGLLVSCSRTSPPANPKPGQIWHDQRTDSDFCYCPPGTFWMGSDRENIDRCGLMDDWAAYWDVPVAQAMAIGPLQAARRNQTRSAPAAVDKMASLPHNQGPANVVVLRPSSPCRVPRARPRWALAGTAQTRTARKRIVVA